MLERIKFLHSRNFIHRDLKPDNFIMGNESRSTRVYMIDFGLSKRYIGKDGTHIPYKDRKVFSIILIIEPNRYSPLRFCKYTHWDRIVKARRFRSIRLCFNVFASGFTSLDEFKSEQQRR